MRLLRLLLAALCGGAFGVLTEPEAPAVGQLEVHSAPPGAFVYVDGVLVLDLAGVPAKTPTRLEDLRGGVEHEVRVVLGRHAPWVGRGVADAVPLQVTLQRESTS